MGFNLQTHLIVLIQLRKSEASYLYARFVLHFWNWSHI